MASVTPDFIFIPSFFLYSIPFFAVVHCISRSFTYVYCGIFARAVAAVPPLEPAAVAEVAAAAAEGFGSPAVDPDPAADPLLRRLESRIK